LSDWEEEEGFDEEDSSEDGGCDYGVTEFCSEPQTRDMNLCTTECQTYLCSVEAEADGGTGKWKCDVCGCTDTTPCPGGCSWVRKNLCSKCADKQKKEGDTVK
jgi:hypothetical protein